MTEVGVIAVWVAQVAKSGRGYVTALGVFGAKPLWRYAERITLQNRLHGIVAMIGWADQMKGFWWWLTLTRPSVGITFVFLAGPAVFTAVRHD